MESRKGRFLDPRLLIFTLHKRSPKLIKICGNMMHDDTTKYCVAGTMDLLTNMLNNVLAELLKWCDRYLMIPHPENCRAMIVQRQSSFISPIQAFRLGNNNIEWTISERLLGVQVDNKLSWLDHVANVAKSFASKLSLLRRMRFLPRKQVEDFYTKLYFHQSHAV